MSSRVRTEFEEDEMAGYGDLDNYDLMMQRKDLKGLSLSLQKYIAGQRILTAIIGHEHSPLAVTLRPETLYKKLSKAKMVWDSKHGRWRPSRQGRSK